MSLFARSVSTLLVLILLLSTLNNTMAEKALIGVTNNLGSRNLTVSCKIDNHPHLLGPTDYYEWKFSPEYNDEFGTEPLFSNCSFQWEGAHHSFDLYVLVRDGDCNNCSWHIKLDAACRYTGNLRFACYQWKT
ncbi:hypothetical protein JHK82_051400 [Glycine max]|nr:hypothetical protein JHK82_051400 [Glycine max]